MTGLVLCQKRISAVRWVMGKYWQFNFLKADFCPGALMETVVVLHNFCAYVSGQGASAALGWQRHGGVPGGVSVPHLQNGSLPLEAALGLRLELLLLQQPCTRLAGLPRKHSFGVSDPSEPSKMVEILVWFFFFFFCWMWPSSSDLTKAICDAKRALIGVHSTCTDSMPK